MPGYEVKVETVSLAGKAYTIRSLLDLLQYSDPTGSALAAGFTSATWPLFGQIWPSARILAGAMEGREIAGRRTLEVGSGLGLASLVLHARNENITASDSHPLCEPFMRENARLNGLPPMKFHTGGWSTVCAALGTFELIIGSDVLYDHGQAETLSGFIDRHSSASVEVVIVDPNRGHRARFCRAMERLGFSCSDVQAPAQQETGERYRGRVLTLRRDRAAPVTAT